LFILCAVFNVFCGACRAKLYTTDVAYIQPPAVPLE
jgi:hypothetical protein